MVHKYLHSFVPRRLSELHDNRTRQSHKLETIRCVVLLCVFTFWVPCCNVIYDFRIITIFGSSLPPVVCRRAHECLIYVMCVCLRIVVSNIYCVVFLFCLSSSYLCCQFLWIVHF